MIKVLAAGFYTTIQDLGRKGFANIGVPISGAMDLYSAKLANQLLGNNENDALLEVTFGGSKLEFLSDAFISISGADFSIKIDDKKVNLNAVIQVKIGSVLSFGKRVYGVRTYIAVFGGFQTEKVLESSSFYAGITLKNKINKGDLLKFDPKNEEKNNSNSSVKINQDHFRSKNIEYFKGPEFDLLNSIQKEQLISQSFTISNDNSRMGYKLNEVIENDFSSMLTSGVLPGTVQLTPSGKLIVLMRDCQVTGGYPRILQLSEPAINQLAQKTTGDLLNFKIK